MLITNNKQTQLLTNYNVSESAKTLHNKSSEFKTALNKKDKLLSYTSTDTYTSTTTTYTNTTVGSDQYLNLTYNKIIEQTNQSPYGCMADANGFVTFNGVTYQYNCNSKYLDLGDVSNEDNILTIPLSCGDTLRVNRDNIDDLAKSIGMFTPQDQKRIMDAIRTDAKCKEKKQEVEDFINKTYEQLLDKKDDSTKANQASKS